MKNLNNYYPGKSIRCEAIHKVRDWSYVRKLIRAAKKGEEIPPILVWGQIGSGQLLNGTHRCAANDIMKDLGYDECLMIPVVTINDLDDLSDHPFSDELKEAIKDSDYERIDNILDR